MKLRGNDRRQARASLTALLIAVLTLIAAVGWSGRATFVEVVALASVPSGCAQVIDS